MNVLATLISQLFQDHSSFFNTIPKDMWIVLCPYVTFQERTIVAEDNHTERYHFYIDHNNREVRHGETKKWLTDSDKAIFAFALMFNKSLGDVFSFTKMEVWERSQYVAGKLHGKSTIHTPEGQVYGVYNC